MAIPIERSKVMNGVLDSLTDHSNKIRKNICTWCGKDAVEFKDELSKKEYTISGMCQVCQDSIFEED